MMKQSILFLIAAGALSFGSKAHDHDHHHVPDWIFVENQGQWTGDFRYKAEIGALAVFVEEGGMTWSLLQADAPDIIHDALANDTRPLLSGHVWKVEMIGADPAAIVPENTASFKHNYFLGSDRNAWRSNVGVHEALLYDEVWPGIDLRIHQSNGNFKYDLLLEAGADPDRIAFKYTGPDAMRIDEKGRLVISTSVGELIEEAPVVWYADDPSHRVECRYILDNDVLSYELIGAEKGRAIVIDPTLIASTVSGSSVTSFGHSATFDLQGNIYTGAISFGQGYNTTPGAFQTTFGGGGTDVSITKYDPTGAQQLYSTYIGGNDGDYPHSLVVDENLNLWVLATSNSTDYPVTTGAVQTSNGGNVDIVVTKLAQNGQSLIGSTYFGGSAIDGRNSLTSNYGDNYRGEIIVDAQGNAFIASCTNSSDFPVSSDALQTASGGGQDGVVFSLDPTLTTLRWSTYFGGSQGDMAFGLRVDADGSILVAGGTASSDLQTTSDVVNPTLIGNHDAFIARINDLGNTLLASTFWGSTSSDEAFFLDLDQQGAIYIYGQTSGNIPIQPAGTYGTAGGSIFVAKVDPTLAMTHMSTTLGSFSSMSPIAFMVDLCERIFISGHGGLGGVSGMPTTPDAFQTSGGFYVGAFESNMADLLFGTYYGANSDHVDGGTSRFDPNGVVYQGVCTGGGFPTTPWAYSQNQSSSWDIAVFKIDMEQSGVQVGVQADATEGCIPADFQLIGSGNSPIYIWDLGDGSDPIIGDTINVSFEEVGTYVVTLIGIDSATCNIIDSAFVTLNVGDAVNIAASFEADPISSCDGYGAQFNNTSTPSSSLIWDFGDGTSSSNEDPTHTYDQPGTYEVWLTIEDAVCGGSDSVMVPVTIPPATLELELPAEYICPESTAMLDAGGGFDSYEWSTGETAQMISVQQPGSYIVSITDGFCTATDTIEVGQAPVAPKMDDLFGCPGLETRLDVPMPVAQVTWNTGEDTASIVVTDNGTYWYTAIDQYGCLVQDTVEVLVIPVEEARAMVPNVFTPNGDGKNDHFQVQGLHLTDFYMEVYNRWGQIVFESSNPGHGWNGGKDNSADDTPDGTYFYVVKFKDECADGAHTTHKGHVTLLR